MQTFKRYYFQNGAICGNCNGAGLQGYMDYCRACSGKGIESFAEFRRHEKGDLISLMIEYNESVARLTSKRV